MNFDITPKFIAEKAMGIGFAGFDELDELPLSSFLIRKKKEKREEKGEI
jgi:hypothetical protein